MFEDVNLIRWLLACIALTLMLGGLVLTLKHLQQGGRIGQRQGRLKVTDSLHIDPRRKLMVVQFDDTEHLVLSGPSGEAVIKSQPVKTNKSNSTMPKKSKSKKKHA